LLKPDKTLDINIHDTYIVIALFHLAVFISIIFGFLGFGYWLVIMLNRKLVNWLTIIHLIITVIGFCLILLIPFFLPASNQDIDSHVTVTLSALAAVCVQLLYPINIITSLIRKIN
jgi:heme/copper-type cytochrome/quinol oxidase subunit 1